MDATQLSKIPTTYGRVQPGDTVDGEKITDVERNTVNVGGDPVSVTRLEFGPDNWGAWLLSNWHVSVYR